MYEAKKERRQVRGGTSLAATSLLLSTILLAGCGSAGDTNSAQLGTTQPEGGSGCSDCRAPQITTEQLPTPLTRTEPVDNQTAEHTQAAPPASTSPGVAPQLAEMPASPPVSGAANGKAPHHHKHAHAKPAVTASTEVPTPPPAHMDHAPVVSQAAQLPAAPVATVPHKHAAHHHAHHHKPPVVTAEAPVAHPPVKHHGVATMAQPVQVAAAAPTPLRPEPNPPMAAIPVAAPVVPAAAVVPVPAEPSRPKTVEEIYRERLAEFSAPPSRPQLVIPSTPAAASAPSLAPPSAAAQRIVLIPPSEFRHRRGHDNGGAEPLSAFNSSKSAASFQVDEVAFGEGTSALPKGEYRKLKDVVELFHQMGGTIRILGRSTSSRLDVDPRSNIDANRQLAASRAAAVARALIRMGVPRSKVFAGAALGAGLSQTAGSEFTEIYIDY